VHAITVTTADGLVLNGWHLLPDGCSAADNVACDRELSGGGFVVLYFYGNAGSRTNDVQDCRDFTALGCHVFLFDYRGYGDNPGQPSEAGFAADALAIWRYATDERHIAPERILIFGQSLGGAVAVQLAAEACKQQQPPAGVIVNSTFSSMADVAGWHYPYLPVRLLLADGYPSIERIGSITAPLLAFHGTSDDIVPLEIGKRLFAAAPENSAGGVTKRWIELPGAAHNDIPRRAFQNGVRDFLKTVRASHGDHSPVDLPQRPSPEH
jgi:fermentation-respiration switch protein FrsA (DUF1100 family)